MKKNELAHEHIEKINIAVRKGLGRNHWELIDLFSGGLTGIPVYKIIVDNKLYAIKLEEVNDSNFDLERNYNILETVSNQGISPMVHYADADYGIVLMKYIESKPRPEASSETIQDLSNVIRQLHEKNSFSKWKSVIEIL